MADVSGFEDSLGLAVAALQATGVSFTVADVLAQGQPLVWVNAAFTAETGYTSEFAVGRNCRFLQGPGSDPGAVRQMREAIAGGTELAVTVLNYRRDGSEFWNEVTLSPVRGVDGRVTHYVAVQTDVTARVRAQEAQQAALVAERDSRWRLERAHGQLALLAEATSELVSTLDEQATVQRLARLVVPALADWVVVATLSPRGLVLDVRAHHRDARDADLADLIEYARQWAGNRKYRALLPAQRAVAFPDVAERVRRLPAPLRELLVRLGTRDAVLVPLHGRGQVLGVMALVRSAGAYTDEDVAVAGDLGRRAGLALDNARLYAAEHNVATTLQRSLLPALPHLQGMSTAARYRASESAADVGGDFYEVLGLPDGAAAIAVGDVVGHDVLAAAAMGHLRGLLRATVWDSAVERRAGDEAGSTSVTGRAAPGAVLSRVDRLLQGLEGTTLATAVVARVQRLHGPQDGHWHVRYSSAGHPPLLVRLPDLRVLTLDGGDGLMLGVADLPRLSGEVVVPDGSVLLGYTDGLVERRGESLDVGLARLRAVLSQAPDDLDELCEQLMTSLERGDDDVALLAVRLEPQVSPGRAPAQGLGIEHRPATGQPRPAGTPLGVVAGRSPGRPA